MAVNRGLTKAERWSHLMSDFRKMGQSGSFPEPFARKWVEVALIATAARDRRATQLVTDFFGLGEAEPMTMVEAGKRVNLSSRWAFLNRHYGTALLKGELIRLWQLSRSTPPHEGSLGLLRSEVFSEDCVIKTTSRSRWAHRDSLHEASRMARRLTKVLVPNLADKLGRLAHLSDLAALSPQQIRKLAGGLGVDSLRWFEDYVHLFGIVLPDTETVYGMRPEARDVLSSMNVL